MNTKKKVLTHNGTRIIGRGLAVSGGEIEGIVTILNTFPEYAIDKTRVVITKYLKPFNSPFVLNAAALITEEGGEFCHAAIVARELGIPCIIISNILSKVKENQRVIVDGDKGIILDASLS